MSVKDIKKEICTGCKMCGDICPNGAIDYTTDKEGFWTVYVDEKKCNACGLCSNRCPVINGDNIVLSENRTVVYEAYNRDCDYRKNSTSGGLFAALSLEILDRGGCVAGCSYSDDYKSAYHSIIDKREDLYKLMGSKYLQSDTEGVYRLVKAKLDEGIEVLFSGTPCQNAALRAYLNKSYVNLYQLDFVCNSVNSPLVYKKWLEEIETKNQSRIKRVRFKDKKFEWKNLTTRILFENGHEYKENREDSLFEKGLIEYGLFQRKSCYDCRFRSNKHGFSDITCGDFWGLENMDPYDEYMGVSLVIVNSDKGEALLKQSSHRLMLKKRNIEDVKKGNPRLDSNPKPNNHRDEFFSLLEKKDFSEAFCRSVGISTKTGKEKRSFLKELISILNEKDISVWKYFQLNYLTKNIVLEGKGRIIPYKNTIIDLKNNGQICIQGDKNVYIGQFKLKGSKTETLIRVGNGGKLVFYHGASLSYGVTIEVKDYAEMICGFVECNTGTSVIAHNRITIGDDVMTGRNCIVMDSDFHQVQTKNGKSFNFPRELIIKDHVWLAGDDRIQANNMDNVTIIGCNVIIGPNVVISDSIPDNCSVKSNGGLKIDLFNGRWSRCSNKTIRKGINSKGTYKQILIGFGKEGREYYHKQKEYIDIVIDNNSTDDRVVSFDAFCERTKDIGKGYAIIIGSSKYYRELYKMVKSKYPNIPIFKHTDVLCTVSSISDNKI